MTMKVYLHTRRPEQKEGDNQIAVFARIPVVGEYLTIPSPDEYWYKVVLVVHIPVMVVKGEQAESSSEWDAEVYAIGIDYHEAHKASGYHHETIYQMDER